MAGRPPVYSAEEHIPVISADNPLELGKLTALSFLTWVNDNPAGVVALPTGKTPEFFMMFLAHFKKNWTSEAVQKGLGDAGLRGSSFPDTSNLTFVQIDEFFGIDPSQENSFRWYVEHYYVPLLEIRSENLILIDSQGMSFEDGAAYCEKYEAQIDDRGGIGFFLGRYRS